MSSLSPYLYFNGNCEEAFYFYQKIFGGKFGHIGRFKEMPAEYNVAPEDGERIMHISLQLNAFTTLMGSDILSTQIPNFTQGNNFSISINTESKEEADHLFEGLSDGAHISMPLNKTFWGSYFGSLTDKYGIQWMISFAE